MITDGKLPKRKLNRLRLETTEAATKIEKQVK